MLVLVGFAGFFRVLMEPWSPAPAPACPERTRHAVSGPKGKATNNARTLACNTRTCSWTHVALPLGLGKVVQIIWLRTGRRNNGRAARVPHKWEMAPRHKINTHSIHISIRKYCFF
jgi:hypothetical protein